VGIGVELESRLSDRAGPRGDHKSTDTLFPPEPGQRGGQEFRQVWRGVGIWLEMSVCLPKQPSPEVGQLLRSMRPWGSDQKRSATGLLKLVELGRDHALLDPEDACGLVEGAGPGEDLEAADALVATLAEQGAGKGLGEAGGSGNAGGMAGAAAAPEGDPVFVSNPSKVGGRRADLGGDVR